jgi:hypothetical protein
MWKHLLTLTARFWRLAEDNERNETAIKELRQDLDGLADQVKCLAFELRRTQENDAHEREKLALRLANELLKFERRLPAPRKG